MICALSFFAENFFHTISQQIWFIWEEGSQSKVTVIFYFLFFLSLDNFHEIGWDILCGQVPLNVCEWFKDYQPVSTEKQEIEHAYEWVFSCDISVLEKHCVCFFDAPN